eukprot:2005234-Pyramimonas_sp.AAC.1
MTRGRGCGRRNTISGKPMPDAPRIGRAPASSRRFCAGQASCLGPRRVAPVQLPCFLLVLTPPLHSGQTALPIPPRPSTPI